MFRAQRKADELKSNGKADAETIALLREASDMCDSYNLAVIGLVLGLETLEQNGLLNNALLKDLRGNT